MCRALGSLLETEWIQVSNMTEAGNTPQGSLPGLQWKPRLKWMLIKQWFWNVKGMGWKEWVHEAAGIPWLCWGYSGGKAERGCQEKTDLSEQWPSGAGCKRDIRWKCSDWANELWYDVFLASLERQTDSREVRTRKTWPVIWLKKDDSVMQRKRSHEPHSSHVHGGVSVESQVLWIRTLELKFRTHDN